MKANNIFAVLGLALASLSANAQSTESEAGGNATPQHLLFQGIPIGGNIDTFTENLKPRYKLKKKVGGDHYFIYEGPVFGCNTYLQASFSRKSRTVYKVVITPKNINQMAWVDSLSVHYGEPVDTDRGLLWQRPEGMVLFYAPEGYDCALFFLDQEGNDVFVKEK